MNLCACGCGNEVSKASNRFIHNHDKRLPESSFWNRVNKTDSCWLWTGSKTRQGYGMILRNGRINKCHRFSWELSNGAIPQGLCLLHRCDTPACVNPDHLFLGTNLDNVTDMILKGRARHARGDTHGRSKLREDYIPAIRCMAHEGWPQKSIARQFGVSVHTLKDLLHGKTWKSVPI